jgi:ribosomal protein S18 acetylase RimI-like enzyme
MTTPREPDQVTVRPAVIDDVDALVALGNRLEGEAEFMLGSAIDPASGASLIKASLEDASDDGPRCRVFVAETGGAIIGICLCRELAHRAQQGVVQFGLGVDDEFRRRGIGRALTDQALAWAAGAGVRRMQLAVIRANAPALRLYEQAGFEIEGTLRRAAKIDGQFHDLHVMAKILAGD